MKPDQTDLGKSCAAKLARVLVRCVAPMLASESPQHVQALLNAIDLLAPRCDTRQLRGLTHYRLGEYMEALRCWSEFDDPKSRALCVLCLRCLGEPSWWGTAQAIYESGDAEAIAVLEPWMNATPSVASAPLDTVPARDALVESADYSFRPMRA